MKKLALLILVLGGLISCSKDALEFDLAIKGPEKSEILVRASTVYWTGDQCEIGCIGTDPDEVIPIQNARVKLYLGSVTPSDEQVLPILNTRTGLDGTVLIEDVEPDRYTIYVETEEGTKSRSFVTQLHQRSFIDFSF